MSKDKSLVIVESPAKARTISKFLGKDFTVEASIGHIRDLPQGAKELPEKYKSEKWAYLGVNVEEDFQPIYVVPTDKKKHVSKLKALLKDAKDLYLATDEDREGEAISWHLHEVLAPKVPVHRLVFHEITKEAIQKSAREHSPDRRRFGSSSRDATRARPTVRLRRFATSVEKGRPEIISRTRAKRRGSVDRRSRTRTNGVPLGDLFGLARKPRDRFEAGVQRDHGQLQRPAFAVG